MKTREIDLDTSPNFNTLKNKQKLTLLVGIDLSKYSEKMIKLLLDGDYKGELREYEEELKEFISEIIQNKVKHTKFGVNTLLYKLVRDAKRPENIEVDEKTFIETILKVAKTDVEEAISILKFNLSPKDPLFKKIVQQINNIYDV